LTGTVGLVPPGVGEIGVGLAMSLSEGAVRAEKRGGVSIESTRTVLGSTSSHVVGSVGRGRQVAGAAAMIGG
jgi:hypothetical protein